MAAFKAEVEAICVLLRLLWWGCVLFRDHNAFIYASNSDKNDIVPDHRIQLRTAAKHIDHALLVAMHFLEIEGCESADSLISQRWELNQGIQFEVDLERGA